MRVIYILSGTEANGGATKSFVSMAKAVQSAGNEVAVVAPNEKGITRYLKKNGWSVLVVPYGFCSLPPLVLNARNVIRFFPRLVKGFFLNRNARKKVLDFAKEFKPDLIHDNTSVTDIGHHVAKELNLPHVVHVREYGWKDFRLVLPGLKKRLNSRDTWLVAITKALARFRGKGVDPTHMEVIYNGVIDKETLQWSPLKSNYFLYAGRIEKNKGIGDLIEAYRIYAQKCLDNDMEPVRLKIAGEAHNASYIESLHDQVKGAGLENLVDWLGNVDGMNELYAQAIATVIPSFNEGFGRVMPEAMAAGCLCVARDTGGLAEQMENGVEVTGSEIAFRFRDISELADLLWGISETIAAGNPFAENGEYKKMIEAAQTTVISLYTKEGNGDAVLAFYDNILGRNLENLQ